jgi:hypothetical protein
MNQGAVILLASRKAPPAYKAVELLPVDVETRSKSKWDPVTSGAVA